jgi:SWIM zinc finger
MHRYHDENKEHYASKHLQHVLKVRPPIAKHAATVYMRIIFNMFEDEVLESLWLTKKKLEKISSSYTYLVLSIQTANQKYVVTVDTSSWDAACQCHLFEFKDILCRHILMIFIKKCTKILTKHILQRWTKEAANDIPTPLTIETINHSSFAPNKSIFTLFE